MAAFRSRWGWRRIGLRTGVHVQLGKSWAGEFCGVYIIKVHLATITNCMLPNVGSFVGRAKRSVLELNEAAYLLGPEDANLFVRDFHTWEGVCAVAQRAAC
jgi:hypothetical protein